MKYILPIIVDRTLGVEPILQWGTSLITLLKNKIKIELLRFTNGIATPTCYMYASSARVSLNIVKILNIK